MVINEINIYCDKNNYDPNFIGFANVVLSDVLILKSIGIWKIGGGKDIRITFPKKGVNSIEVYHPIDKDFFNEMKKSILNKLHEQELI